ncbi:sulfate ABC transporter substrate-binding protein [Intrasporangium calvum]|uniref:sulfate ABC transporter substrate-binding protein n=1 Tax=Intrasporangium calvum TaxID=53358 RepID=UPI000DF61408|nr:sulfate ABC transporter substrate-binding protein [Intrasporangium calvum]AXG12342.1 sulfate ABC transporter substrate-binding protein [Intrasporangium calvum]
MPRPRPTAPRSRILRGLAALAVLALAGCTGAGPSDVVVQPGAARVAAAPTTTLNLFAHAVAKPAHDAVVPAFQRTPAGTGVAFQQSYGASGDQSRKVAAGAEADLVQLSTEPDLTRLVDAGLIDPTWNAGEHGGVPFGSVVTLVVRTGNPKGIADWDDLLQPEVEVVTPNPFSSGSARWNLLAPFAAESHGGADPAAGLAYVEKLVSEHVRIQPKSSREATEAFLQGRGDVLLSYENEALFIEQNGDPVEHVTPPQTFRIDNPVAVLKGSENLPVAEAFADYLYTPEAQRLVARAGFRPVDEQVAAEFAKAFPRPEKLWTIADLGGWTAVDAALFEPRTGAIATIYDAVTQ